MTYDPETTTEVTLPGGLVVRAGGVDDQDNEDQPEWGVYADDCWVGWPGVILDWPDFGLPTDEDAAFAAIKQAFGRLRQGQDVLIGCRGGTGRTGTMLACLAILAGVPPEAAVAWVRKRYRPRAVETSEQERWISERFGTLDWVGEECSRSRKHFIDTLGNSLRLLMVNALGQPEKSPMLAWAIPDILAITQRPLRAHPVYGGSRSDYAPEARSAIDEWMRRLLENHRIRSVIVLTSSTELGHYDVPTVQEGGLLSLYRAHGLAVTHFPADDPAHDVRAKHAFDEAVDAIAERVAERLEQLPLPAVMHCSAAIDRSPPVAARVAFLHEVGVSSLDA